MKFILKFRLYYILCIILMLPASVSAQYNAPENSVWVYADQEGYNFNIPSQITISPAINSIEVGTAISNSQGQLLFYTDGMTIWNKNNNIMPSGVLYSPQFNAGDVPSTTQGTLIVPHPGNANQYFVFTLPSSWDSITHWFPSPGAGFLYYTIVDMSLDNGLGDVVPGTALTAMGTPLLSEKLIAVPGCNCVWVIVHDALSSIFRVYKIDASGINPAPVISNTGSACNGRIIGQMSISPDYHKLAAAHAEAFSGIVELYDFDNTNGNITATTTIDSINYIPYGICFSPNGKRLYTNGGLLTSPGIVLKQYNIDLPTTAQIQNSEILINTNQTSLSQLQLGPDGKIYLNTGNQNGSNRIGRIEHPNNSGLACGYSQNAIQFPTKPWPQDHIGIQNLVMKAIPYTADTIHRLWKDTIFCSEVVKRITAESGINYLWSDGTTDQEKIFNQPGTYWVQYFNGCTVYIDTVKVAFSDAYLSIGNDTTICKDMVLIPQASGPIINIKWQDNSTTPTYKVTQGGPYTVEGIVSGCPLKDSVYIKMISLEQDLGNDIRLCSGSPVKVNLKVTPPDAQTHVQWSNGSTDNATTADRPGIYSVTLTHPSCDPFTTEIKISNDSLCDCAVLVPNTFTPNGDGKNETWSPMISPDCHTETYMLRIFNRWGQCVFTAENINQKWDGTYKGEPAPQDTYMYEVSFYKGTTLQRFYQKGDLTLLR